MILRRIYSVIALSALMSGCAQLPDVTVGYALSKTKISFKVVRTVACDGADNVVVATSVTPVVAHAADPLHRETLAFAPLKGAFSDSDIKLDLYEDGRLKGINASTTGQGEAILKTVVTLATAAFGFDGGAKSTPTECAFIKTAGGGKPLTLTYDDEIDLAADAITAQTIKPDTASAFYAVKLKDAIGGVCAFVTGKTASSAPVAYAARDGDVVLNARQPGLAQIRVTAGPSDQCQSNEVWRGSLPVAQFGTPYAMPVPKAALFGKKVFAASFAESGALTSVQYAGNTGAGQALTVANAAFAAAQPDTAAQKAADTKAQADLIVQQQRLVQCVADPASCK